MLLEECLFINQWINARSLKMLEILSNHRGTLTINGMICLNNLIYAKIRFLSAFQKKISREKSLKPVQTKFSLFYLPILNLHESISVSIQKMPSF